jgi:hypothetical protein
MAIQGGSGGGGRGASDVRAGGAFFEVYAKDGMSGVLRQLEGKVKSFGSMMRRAGAGMIGGGAALGAGPLGFLFGGVNRATEVSNLSRQFQVPIDMMARLKYAADAAGASVEDVMGDPARFADLLSEAPGMDPATVAQAVAANREYRLTIASLQNSMLSLLVTIMPVVKAGAEFVRQNAAGIAVIGSVAFGLLALGTAFTVAGFAVAGLVVGVKLLLTPIGLLVIAGSALAYLFREQLAEAFRTTGEVFGTTWGGIVDAVKAGNLELAFEVLSAGVKRIWQGMLLWMVEKLNATVKSISNLFGRAAIAFGPVAVLARELHKSGALDRMEADLKANIGVSDARLRAVRQQAAAGVPQAAMQQQLIRAAEMVRGGFNIGRNPNQTFGYGDTTRKILADMLDDQKNGLAPRIAEAMGGFFKVR